MSKQYIYKPKHSENEKKEIKIRWGRFLSVLLTKIHTLVCIYVSKTTVRAEPAVSQKSTT